MNVYPIIFSGAMVRALLQAGDQFKVRKSQTRRIPTAMWNKVEPGDLLYVREAFAFSGQEADARVSDYHDPAFVLRPHLVHRATSDGYDETVQAWRPSIHMPRWASRLTLEVTDVREQPLHRITWGDVKAEGLPPIPEGSLASLHFEPFIDLWDSLHGKKPGEAWADNPTVIAIVFKVHEMNVDTLLNTRKETAA